MDENATQAQGTKDNPETTSICTLHWILSVALHNMAGEIFEDLQML